MAAMLHGRNNENVLHKKEHFFPIGKRIYCSCHATWLLCKTSIRGGILARDVKNIF